MNIWSALLSLAKPTAEREALKVLRGEAKQLYNYLRERPGWKLPDGRLCVPECDAVKFVEAIGTGIKHVLGE
jgi:hypothetical protein